MQRLEDILTKDVETVFTYYRDFTRQVVIQSGSEQLTVWGSLQTEEMTANAEAKPINMYGITFDVRESDLTDSFKKKLVADAILYIEGIAYRVIDTSESGGIVEIALTRGAARGSIASGRPI